MEITETEALNRVVSYCAAAEHCRAEIVEKLQRWGVPYGTIDRIVEQLVRENYIDEVRFCRAFVSDKFRLAKWGKVKIAQALQLKKISPMTYLPLLNEIDSDDYLNLLRSLLTAKKKSIHAENEFELNGKLVRFALSRGFEMKDIRLCIDVPDENEPAE